MAAVEREPSVIFGAVVLAAGRSSRMGQPKMVLPWGQGTVISSVVDTLVEGGVQQVVVVTGGAREAVEAILAPYPHDTVLPVFNDQYANGEMLTSLQVGLRTLLASPQGEGCAAFLLALGDQPQMQAATVSAVIAAYRASGAALVVPSYQMRRGHPWLVDRSLWDGLLEQPLPFTLRDFLNQHRQAIHYVNVDTPSILADLDTPEDYRRHSQASG